VAAAKNCQAALFAGQRYPDTVEYEGRFSQMNLKFSSQLTHDNVEARLTVCMDDRPLHLEKGVQCNIFSLNIVCADSVYTNRKTLD
jgi:hypothetical protein